MTGPKGGYRLKLLPNAKKVWDQLEATDPRRLRKVKKALALLKENPAHPGLSAHKWRVLKGKAPDGGDVWTAYVENKTPGAWRIFYFFDKAEPGVIFITAIEPHS